MELMRLIIIIMKCSYTCIYSLCMYMFHPTAHTNYTAARLQHAQCREYAYMYTREHSVRKEGNVLFNDALNTFYLRLYDVIHMVKDHSDSERGNQLLPLHGLLFLISSKVSFKCTTPTDSKAHTTACYTSCGALAGMRNSSMGSP